MTGKGVTPAIGIDLGIRHSRVGVWQQDKVEIIKDEAGYYTNTPSVVAFTPTECLIGQAADDQYPTNCSNTVIGFQRLVGRRFNDPEVQYYIKRWNSKVIKGTYGLPKVVVEYKGKETEYSAEELSSMILVQLKNLAESYLGTTVKDAVITVPAYFNESQRQATKVAAHLAGIDVLQIIDVPVAAAFAYGLHKKNADTNVLVFNLDEVTFEVSVGTIDEKGKLTVKATGCDTHFGGWDIRDVMVDHVVKEFNRKHQMEMDITGNFGTIKRLRGSVFKAIVDLISKTETSISIDSLYNGIDFSTSITRSQFEYICESFFTKCIETLESFLRDAKINKTDVDEIVLVGWWTCIPKVQQLLREFFNGKELLKSIDVYEIIKDETGYTNIPSVVAFTRTECLIGEPAHDQYPTNRTNTVIEFQRLVGRRFNDPEVQYYIKQWNSKVIKGTDDLPKVVVECKGKEMEYSAEELSSMFLVHLKSLAESYLGTTVKDAVITVPAYFNESQRQATKVAAHLAGIDVLQIIDDHVAAAVGYGLHKKTAGTNVLVFDLDDVTFEVSIVTIDEKGKLTVKATGGDTHFGGLDIVDVMVDHVVKEFNRKHQMEMDITGNLGTRNRLRGSVFKAIQDLISNTETSISIDSLYNDIDFSTSITRSDFEYICESFFSRCMETLESLLRDAKINKTDVDDIVLVGWGTWIPKVQQLLREFFNGKELLKSIHPKQVVARGATIHAANLIREKREKENTLLTLPLLDTVPLSLGLDAHDGVFSVIIPRKTPIPTEKERIYFTTTDNQKCIPFNVYQGERSKAKDNKWLGKFEVAVSPAPKGKSKVKVVFSIDADGIFSCWVKEFTTGLKCKIIIDNDKGKVSEEEISKMLKDAEKHKMEDIEYKKIMRVCNALEEYIYNVNKKMKTIGSTDKTKLHVEEIKKMESAIEAANQYVDGSHKLADVDEYQNVLDELQKICVGVISRLV